MLQIRNRNVSKEHALIMAIASVWKYQFSVNFNKTILLLYV
jgi:hypothetical protein